MRTLTASIENFRRPMATDGLVVLPYSWTHKQPGTPAVEPLGVDV